MAKLCVVCQEKCVSKVGQACATCSMPVFHRCIVRVEMGHECGALLFPRQVVEHMAEHGVAREECEKNCIVLRERSDSRIPGWCHCGKRCEEDKHACEICRKLESSALPPGIMAGGYHDLKAAGVCVRCRGRRGTPEEGKAHCEACRPRRSRVPFHRRVVKSSDLG